jgi:TonB family protein
MRNQSSTIRAVLAAVLFTAAGARAQAPASPALTPPAVLEAPAPRYPGSETHEGHEGHEETVIVHVTLGADGTLQEAHVDHSVTPAFDAAALEAVRSWRFAPARSGDTPVASNVRVAVRFVPPQLEVGEHPPLIAPTTSSAPPAAPVASPAASPAARAALSASASVQKATTRPAAHAASDFVIERDVLTAAPRKDAAALLVTAPGVYVARGEGDAVAHSIFLRGFDAEHGQDIAFSAGGIPINAPSHVHGQGYADLGFVIPEAVHYVRVTEGVYDPAQGDFAVAGSVDFELGVQERGLHARTSYGSFNTQRQLVLWAPEGQPQESFGAAFYTSTDGFGAQRDGQSAGALAQHVVGTGEVRVRLVGSLYGARARLAGVLRKDDIDRGRVGFYDVYDDPVAQNQSAFASQVRLGVFVEQSGARGGKSEAGVWLAQQAFRLQEAFTGYVERSRFNPEWVGRGDLIEQENDMQSLGLSARHQTQRYALARWAQAMLTVGLQGRFDRIEQAQNLLQPPQNETWDQRVDASITGTDIGGYADLELRINHRLTFGAGVRADALHYAVDDRLGNFIPAFRRDSYIVGFRRSAFGIAVGPRLRAELRVTPWLSALAAYGQGYRSPQARLLEDGESAPYTKVYSSDAGVRLRFTRDERALLTASAFHTELSDDVAFDPAEGRLEPIGPTRRVGGVLHAVVRPFDFLVASASATYVRAELDAPPPATAEDPSPPFRAGELLPYVPPLVLRLDLGVTQRLGRAFGMPLGARAGLGVSHLAERPLPFGMRSAPVTLCDLSLALRYGVAELGVEVFNLLGAQYAATEHVYPSNWDPNALPSRLPARHIAAGPPRSLLLTLGLTL